MGQAMNAPAQQPQTPAPPPLPQTSQYHIAINGQQSGPFDLAALKQYVQNGQLTRDTLVWCQGMANWQAAAQVGELSGLFGAVPPPLPPQG